MRDDTSARDHKLTNVANCLCGASGEDLGHVRLIHSSPLRTAKGEGKPGLRKLGAVHKVKPLMLDPLG